jgi:signal transduction histidine kinase
MGKVARPIRKQIATSFYLILIFSIVATALTWGILLLLLIFQSNNMNPANYYEQQIPRIVKEIDQDGERWVRIENQAKLEKKIPLDGLEYQVLNKDGSFLFGSMKKEYVKNERELVSSFNKNIYDLDRIIVMHPLFNQKKELVGAIGFRYKLSLIGANPEKSLLLGALLILSFACPFIYFYLFSYLIGKRFSKKIEIPFQHLMEGARKIQTQDLDFQLVESKSSKELNQLIRSFEEMRLALRESLLRQWQLEEERKEMVAAIAHDLRTPLTIINGHIEGLLAGGFHNTERLNRYLQTIESSTKRSIRLIDQLNEVSAIDRSDFTIEPVLVDIEEFIQNKVEEYKVLCSKKQITLRYSIKGKEKMKMDPYRISQVLDNIITNSIRYCSEKGQIHWDTTIGYGTIIFEIMDNGPGFKSKATEKVFDKFYREDESRSGNEANFGLGLYIAQTIVKKHHGAITIQNRPEGGAFTKIIISEMT